MLSKRSIPQNTLLRLLLGAALFTVAIPANSARAQDPEEAAPSEESVEKKTVRPTLDLGHFKIKDLRPTRNVTAKITFSIHLALAETLSEQQVERLGRWQHRLRDQVITATRTLEIKDYQEPDLSLMRRKILIRVNRLLKMKLVEEVLFTEYIFRTH